MSSKKKEVDGIFRKRYIVDMVKLTLDEVISRFREVHGDKYDYSKVNYIDSTTKICIICHKHGDFWQTPSSHFNSKRGCRKCSNESFALNTDEVISRFREVHGDKYDYSKMEYKRTDIPVCIICRRHGEFWQTPNSHISYGCRKCGYEKVAAGRLSNTADFIKKSIDKHGNQYDYSKMEYKRTDIPVCIICRRHGEFWQKPVAHFRHGCRKCGIEKIISKLVSGNTEFIEKAVKKHGHKYDYSKVKYINHKKNVCITCPKPDHGDFWQTPNAHLRGQNCPKCMVACYSKGERFIQEWFYLHNIKVKAQKTFKRLLNRKTKKIRRMKLRCDFYLPVYNLLIEFDGVQHFKRTSWFTKKSHLKLKQRDGIKNTFARRNQIPLMRIPYTEFDRLDEILTDALLAPVPGPISLPFFVNISDKTILHLQLNETTLDEAGILAA